MNSNQNISAKITDTLINLGCDSACISPGARNSSIALNLSDKLSCYNILDERSAGYIALGIAKYTNKPVIVNCTSGTALANLFPSIIEARMSEIPMIILTADRPKNLIDKGENQTIYQKEIFGRYVLAFESIDSNSVNIEDAIYTIYNKSIGLSDNRPVHEKGPVHINVHLDEPNESNNLTIDSINTDFKTITPIDRNNSVQINKFQNPLIICGQSNLKEYEDAIFKLSQKLNIPILADISSNIESHTNNILYYDTFIDNIKPDAIFRFGKKPLSKKLNTLIKNCANTYLVRNERLFNDDTKNLISYNQLSDFIDTKTVHLNSNWIESIKKQESIAISTIDDLMTKNKSLNEYSLAYTFNNQIKSDTNIFIGNSIIIRAFNLLFNTYQRNINIFSNRGASGIDGNIATAIGMTISSNVKNNYLILGDQSFMHDIGSLKNLKDLDINLKIIVVNNTGGGIFDYLPISNEDNIKSYKQFIRSDHNDTFKTIAKAYAINYKKVDSLSDCTMPSDDKPAIIELNINRDKSLEIYKKIFT